MKKVISLVLSLALLMGMFGAVSAVAESKPKLSGKVVIYSPHGEEILDAISQWFEEETGVEVEYLFMGGGELVDRIRAEKNNPQADVIYGNPSSVFEQMKMEGLLATSAPTWASELNSSFVDKEGYFYGTIQTPVLLFYNNTLLSADQAPKDWSDLADPKFEGQVVLRSTTSAASRATISALIDQYYQKGTLETEGWDFMKAVDKNVRNYVSDSNLMFQAISKGEGQVGFWTLDGITNNVNDNKMPLTMVVPSSGAVVISDGIALIQGAKNEENARAFIEFAGSKETQLRLAEQFSRIPTLPAALAEAPEWMHSLDIPPMNVDWKTLTEKQSEWLQYYNDEVVDASKTN